jgi:hypothetical protein
MRRLLFSTLLTCLLVALVPNAASAAKPQRTAPARVEFDVPFPDICAFPLVAHVEGFTHLITFVDANGDTVRGWTGGQLFVTWENLETHETRRFAIPGPTFFAADGTPVRGTGPWANPDLDGTWYMMAGNLLLDDAFNTVSLRGRKVPVCSLFD